MSVAASAITETRSPTRQYHGLLALWIALFLWGMHGPAGRYLALKGISMAGLMSTRLWIGCLFFWSFLSLKKKIDLSFLRGNMIRITILSLIGIYFNMLVFQCGMKYVPATLVLLLENLAPFFVILLRWKIDGKTPSSIEAFCQCLAFTGLLVIVMSKGGMAGDWSHFLMGIGLEALAGISWAFYTYFSGRWLNLIFSNTRPEDRFYPCLNFICILLTISAVIATPHLSSMTWSALDFHDYALILMIGILQTGIAYMLWNYALGILPVTLVSICFYMTVVFTCINEMIFLDLRPSTTMLLGAALILGSALQLAYTQTRRSREIALEASPSH